MNPKIVKRAAVRSNGKYVDIVLFFHPQGGYSISIIRPNESNMIVICPQNEEGAIEAYNEVVDIWKTTN